jgi:hypothetical protein
MSIRVACPNCRTAAVCPDEYRGRSLRCKKCGRSFLAGSAGRKVEVASPPAPAGQLTRGRFLIAVLLVGLIGAAAGLVGAYFLVSRDKHPDAIAAGPAPTAADTAHATRSLPSAPPLDTGKAQPPRDTGKAPPAPAAPPAVVDVGPRDTSAKPPPASPPVVLDVGPPAPPPAPAPTPPTAPPKRGLAELLLAVPGGWKANYNKFLPGWVVTKPPPTERSEAEEVRIEECPADARTPAEYAAHLKEKDFLNVDVPGWVEVGRPEDLPDGFVIKGVVKKFGNPKTPSTLGLIAVRDIGGLKVRCFSANLRSEKSRDEVLEMLKGATFGPAK